MRRLHFIAEQKLRTVIEGHNLPLGTTPNGKSWCIKALHPSDPLTDCRGIPDECATPSVFMNYQSTYTIGPAALATGVWSYRGFLLPHPIAFMHNAVTDSVGVRGSNFLNTQLPGTTPFDKYTSWKSLQNRWRLAYMSVTVYQDGADLANQGMCNACQFPSNPQRYNASFPYGGDPAYTATTMVLPHLEYYDQSTYPNFQTAVAYPNAYMNRSREGLYSPMKLTRTHQLWHSRADEFVHISPASIFNDTINVTSVDLPVASSISTFPIGGLEAAAYGWAAAPNLFGCAMPAMGNDTFVNLNFENMAVTTSLKFYVRAGFEIECLPGSTMSPHLKLSPPVDHQAVDCYFAITRELKDAYPADYNDLGEIWDKISEAASVILPGVSMMGPWGALVGTAGNGIKAIGDAIRKKTLQTAADAATSGSANATATAGQVERVAEAVNKPVYGPTRADFEAQKRLNELSSRVRANNVARTMARRFKARRAAAAAAPKPQATIKLNIVPYKKK